MGLQWFPMVLLWFSYGVVMFFLLCIWLWFSYVSFAMAFAMIPLWVCYVLAMVFAAGCYGFAIVAMVIV